MRKYTKESIEKRRQSLLIRNAKKRDERIKTVPFENLSRALRMKILFAERGYRCEECGYAYTDDSRKQKGPYEPHHVDGDNTNWKKENVKIVCLNCHWKTPNYRFRGKKHSSESKKKISLNNYWNRTLSYPNLAEEAGLNPVK